jgi:ubiquinone/menaquinone biosynthesis C-methylase UbiE
VRDAHQYTYWEGQTCRRTSFHPAVQTFAQPKLVMISKILKSCGDTMDSMTVLEAGSGSGHMSIFAKQHCHLLVASDYSMNMLIQNPVDIKLCSDASHLPFADNCFDCVMCTNLIHHLDDPFATVREMRRVSKKYVIIIEPNRNNQVMYLYGLLTKSNRGLLKVSFN